jgi:hypothetical protein
MNIQCHENTHFFVLLATVAFSGITHKNFIEIHKVHTEMRREWLHKDSFAFMPLLHTISNNT